MAPKAMKRPAAATPPAAKRRSVAKVDPIQLKCASIASALQEAESLPQNVRDMLAGNLTNGLAILKVDRHDFQHRVVAMIDEAMTEMGSNMTKAIADAEIQIAAADTNKSALEKTTQDSAQILEEKSGATAAKQQVLNDSNAAKKSAASALKDAEKEENAGNKELNDATKKKNELDDAKANVFKEMHESEATKSTTKMLKTIGDRFGYEGELMKAVTGAFSKALDARGTFDKLVITQFDEQVDKTLAELVVVLEQGEPGKQERAAKVTAAQSALEAADLACQACTQAFAEAEDAESAAKKEAESAKKELQAFTPGLAKICGHCDALKARLASFTENALAAFTELEARVDQPVVDELPTKNEVDVLIAEATPVPCEETAPTA